MYWLGRKRRLLMVMMLIKCFFMIGLTIDDFACSIRYQIEKIKNC